MANIESGHDKRFGNAEIGLSPEKIGGQHYRIPYIWGEGSGFGFSIQNVNLPFAWHEQADKIKQLSQDINIPEAICRYFQDTEAGDVSTIIDQKTGLLISVAVNGPYGYSALQLAHNEFYRASIGAYIAKDVKNIESALILQKAAAVYLTQVHQVLGENITVPYVDKDRSQYYTQDLLFPRKIVEQEKIILSDYGQQLFTRRAHNIAGRFGTDIKDVRYTDKGFLESVTILNGGKATYYALDHHFDNYTYNPHNVDNAREACTLHAIVANFLNDRLVRPTW